LRISQLQKPFSPSSQSKKSINKDKKKKEAANSDEFHFNTHTHKICDTWRTRRIKKEMSQTKEGKTTK